MKHVIKLAAIAAVIISIFILVGCGSNDPDQDSADAVFAPDLTDTEWLGYRVTSDGEYVASAEYSFSQDRIKYLDQDAEYTLHTGEEAYKEALITEEEGEALYSEDSFGGDERGGFITIIMHYENGKDGLYGWTNKSMDKMELTDPYDGARCYLFRKDSDAVKSYEKDVEPFFELFAKKHLTSEQDEEITYSDRVLEITNHMENTDKMTEAAAKHDMVISALEKDFDNDSAESSKLAADLESMLYLDGIKVRLNFKYEDELIASAAFDKSGEIKEERFLYGR